MHLEVKRQERCLLYDYVEQVDRDKKEGELGVIAYRKNGKKWVVIMDAEDWLKLTQSPALVVS